MICYDTCLLTAVGLTPGDSSTVHIYAQCIEQTIIEQTIQRTNKQYIDQQTIIEQTNNT